MRLGRWQGFGTAASRIVAGYVKVKAKDTWHGFRSKSMSRADIKTLHRFIISLSLSDHTNPSRLSLVCFVYL